MAIIVVSPNSNLLRYSFIHSINEAHVSVRLALREAAMILNMYVFNIILKSRVAEQNGGQY